MTFQSKAALRRRLYTSNLRLNEVEAQLDSARIKLDSLGYEGRWVEAAWGSEFEFHRADGADALTPDQARLQQRKATDAARDHALATVIEGLELREYEHRQEVQMRLAFEAPKPEVDTDRLWADLVTALELKAEKKAQEVRQAAADRIAQAAGLTVDISTAELARAIVEGTPRVVTVPAFDPPKPPKKSTPKKSGAQK